MKKGFTLVELLAVIAILGLLIGVSVPVYLTISSRINQSIAETKMAELKSKSEKYAEETGKSVFDVKSLIEAGVLSPDSELGNYKDPVTNRDMSCDIITMQYKNTGYEANITQSDECFEEDYLENLFGMVELYLENASGQEISKKDWLKESKVYVRYRIKPEYQGKGLVSEVSWSGQAPVRCELADINKEQCQKYLVETYENGIKNTEVRLQIKITLNDSGAAFINNVSMKVLLDLQRPTLEGSVNLNNDINTSGARRVSFELTDGAGSGVSGYAFTKDLSSNSCSRVEYKKATDGVQTDYLTSGNYGICVKDQVGNITNDEELQRSRFEVKEIDVSPPSISFTGSAIDGSNGWKKRLTIRATAKDNEGVSSARYCITTENKCLPDINATLKSGTTTREFEVEIQNNKNAQTLCAQVTDLAGNMNEVKCSPFYNVDGKLPNQSFAMGTFKKGTGEWYKELTINVTGADEHSGIVNGRYCITSGSTCNPDKSFNGAATVVTIGNGANPQTVCANYTDTAGNISNTTCMSSFYRVDGTNPTPNVSVGTNTPGSNGWYKDLTVDITGSDKDSGVSSGTYCIGIGAECNPNTSVTGSSKSVHLENNDQGQYVCANFLDNAGNKSTTKCWGPYYVDGVAPVLSSVENYVNGHTMRVIANAFDTHSKKLTYYYKLAGRGWMTGGSNYTFTGVPSGGYSVDVYVVDQAGNRSTNTLNTYYEECQPRNQIKVIPNPNYGSCSLACGGGIQYRDYHMDDVNSGRICNYDQDSRSCNEMDCCSRTVESGRSSWGSCSVACGGGTQYQDIYYVSAYDGSSCPTDYDGASQSCNEMDCCSRTVESGRGPWSSCSELCGGGTQYQDIYYESAYDGSSCPSEQTSQSCNTQNCCDSTRTDYGPWGSCSKDCGGGTKYRTVYEYSTYNGQLCDKYSDSDSCNTESCCECSEVCNNCEPGTYVGPTSCYMECNYDWCPTDGQFTRKKACHIEY